MAPIFYFIRRMRSPRGLVLFACIFTIALASVKRASAQEQTGTITGVVADTTGAVIAGATINVTDADRGNTFLATSDEQGRYSLRNLPAGRYSVRIQKSGFKVVKLRVLTLKSDQTADANIYARPIRS